MREPQAFISALTLSPVMIAHFTSSAWKDLLPMLFRLHAVAEIDNLSAGAIRVKKIPPLKRCFDILISGIGILISLPLWVVIGILIYLEDRKAVFLSQPRVGRGGRLFNAYKFRSMKPEAQRLYPNLQARENDPRITRIGKFLRATATDELPQLLNIFIGDMSFVGPRALLPTEVEVGDGRGKEDRIAPRNELLQQEEQIVEGLFRKRCSVLPGLTGVAQVYAPRDIPRRKKFRYDLFYIRHQSFLFDLKLIVLSFWITFRGGWEKRADKLNRRPRSAPDRSKGDNLV